MSLGRWVNASCNLSENTGTAVSSSIWLISQTLHWCLTSSQTQRCPVPIYRKVKDKHSSPGRPSAGQLERGWAVTSPPTTGEQGPELARHR